MNKREFVALYLQASNEVKNQISVLIENQPQRESQESHVDTERTIQRPC